MTKTSPPEKSITPAAVTDKKSKTTSKSIVKEQPKPEVVETLTEKDNVQGMKIKGSIPIENPDIQSVHKTGKTITIKTTDGSSMLISRFQDVVIDDLSRDDLVNMGYFFTPRFIKHMQNPPSRLSNEWVSQTLMLLGHEAFSLHSIVQCMHKKNIELKHTAEGSVVNEDLTKALAKFTMAKGVLDPYHQDMLKAYGYLD